MATIEPRKQSPNAVPGYVASTVDEDAKRSATGFPKMHASAATTAATPARTAAIKRKQTRADFPSA